jgi:general secretion pathway protein G
MMFSLRSLPGGQEFPQETRASSAQAARRTLRRKVCGRGSRGLSLIELIVAITILLILTSAAIPIARVRIKREKERELRHALWEMRDGIDRYKDAADRGAFQIKLGSEGYPPDLDTLVKGVDVAGKKIRFLRRVPVDPLTGQQDWGKRCISDDPKSDSWCGDNVYDVFTKAQGMGMDGSKYSEW